MSGELTDADVDRARRTIGIPTPGRSTAWVDQADASSIGHFAFGYGDDNPLWHDEGYAGRTRWRGIIAPPTYLIAVGVNEAPPLDPETKALFKGLFSGLGKYYAGVDFEWWRPVVAGDVLHVERSTSDVEVKTSAFSGSRSVIETYQSLYVDRLGECVAVRRERYVSAERSGTKASGKHADLARQEWTAEGIAALDAVYEAEERRGAVSRWWEEVEVGDLLVPVMKGPLTMVDIISMHMGMGWGGYDVGPLRYAWDLRRRVPSFYELDPFGVPDVVQRLHWDADRAQELGLPAPYDYGQMRTAWLSHLITNWMGDDAWLVRLESDTRGFNFHGDAHICVGEVTGLRLEDGLPAADLAVAAMNQREEVTCSGTATVLLPSHEHGPVRLPRPPEDLRLRAASSAVEAARSRAAGG